MANDNNNEYLKKFTRGNSKKKQDMQIMFLNKMLKKGHLIQSTKNFWCSLRIHYAKKNLDTLNPIQNFQ